MAYFPYFWHADPSVKRASGLLIPTIGLSSKLGVFFDQPYYWVIDDQSDATFTPMMTTNEGPELDVEYRRRFNDGMLTDEYIDRPRRRHAAGDSVLKGQFSYDDTWRWGFDINRASSGNYIQDFRLSQDFGTDVSLLASQVYLEGFGEGAYARLELAVLSKHQHGDHQQQAAGRVAAVSSTATSGSPTVGAAGSASMPGRSMCFAPTGRIRAAPA